MKEMVDVGLSCEKVLPTRISTYLHVQNVITPHGRAQVEYGTCAFLKLPSAIAQVNCRRSKPWHLLQGICVGNLSILPCESALELSTLQHIGGVVLLRWVA